ncbi:MAG: type II toxin-antitoxin system RelE/ParE family toxin [Verrucomicrobiales bacterium]|nr:type II toxin-antitoxin system RelE/ParE family toxin [Verrucomicrobiales bacterium]
MLGYEYHPDAEAEYHAAIRYYSRIRAELGMSFVTEVEKGVERARLFPEAHRKISGDLRRVLTRRFSYHIIYEVLENQVFIWAVAHTGRKPGYWKDRLQGG